MAFFPDNCLPRKLRYICTLPLLMSFLNYITTSAFVNIFFHIFYKLFYLFIYKHYNGVSV